MIAVAAARRGETGGDPVRRTVLLTGATGLLGSALLEALLDAGHRVLAAARTREGIPAQERIERILGSRGAVRAHDALQVVNARSAATLEADLKRFDEPTDVIHAAAAVKFDATVADLDAQNFQATAQLLDTLDRVAPASRFHFVSTAYVCGAGERDFTECSESSLLPCRHPYEASKRLAERLVWHRARALDRPFTVLRPSIIAGSAADGRAANFNGIYALLRILDALARRPLASPTPSTRAFFHCDPDVTKNIVPVDWVARAIVALLPHGGDGERFHLTHPRPVRQGRLVEMAAAAVGVPPPLVRRDLPGPGAPRHRDQAVIDRTLRSLRPYLWDEPVFGRSNVERALGAGAVPPDVDAAYLGRLLEFARRVGWSSHPLEDLPDLCHEIACGSPALGADTRHA